MFSRNLNNHQKFELGSFNVILQNKMYRLSRHVADLAALSERPRPDRKLKSPMVRAEPIGPGREVWAETKLELPKLRAGLTVLPTATRSDKM